MDLAEELGGPARGIEGATAAIEIERGGIRRERRELGELAEDRLRGTACDDRHAALDEGLDAGDRRDDEGLRGDISTPLLTPPP